MVCTHRRLRVKLESGVFSVSCNSSGWILGHTGIHLRCILCLLHVVLVARLYLDYV